MKTYSRHDFPREERAARAKVAISAALESKEQADGTLHRSRRLSQRELSYGALNFVHNDVWPFQRLNHRDGIKQSLSAHYFDVSRLEAANDLIIADAGETLSRFMLDGMPDAVRFKESMIPLIELACRGRKDCVIRAYGEMVDVLWKSGETAAAIRLEMLWNQLSQTHLFALLCGYSWGTSTRMSASKKCVNSTRISCPIQESVSPAINLGC